MITSIVLVLCFNYIYCQDPFVHSGKEANIIDFSHSACLNVISCYLENGKIEQWICGASILNQRILLTAAHCVYGCSRYSSMAAQTGSGNRNKADVRYIQKFKVNEYYDEFTNVCDIALLKLQSPLVLGDTVGRVTLHPQDYVPYGEEGEVAGWGYVDEPQIIERASILQYTTQKIMKRKKCMKFLGETIPLGTLCGIEDGDESYISAGDSGSALMVRKYIQAGLVSFKFPTASSLVVYTDVGYHYHWIYNISVRVFCDYPTWGQGAKT